MTISVNDNMSATHETRSSAYINQSKMHNPYLDEARGFVILDNTDKASDELNLRIMRGEVDDYLNRRNQLAKKYSYSVPTQEAIEAISRFTSSVVEIGAGSGYWASLLSLAGVDVEAFDINVSKNPWFDVQVGDSQAVRTRSERTLLLCWPPDFYSDEAVRLGFTEEKSTGRDMSLDTLSAYMEAGGESLIYIGEGWGGCGGSIEFHNLIQDKWDLVEKVNLPKWSGLKDSLFIYKRKQENKRMV